MAVHAVSGTGSANPVVRQDQAGVILSVTPRISPEEVIVMEVSAEKSQYRGQGVPLFTDANNGNVIESPIKDIIKASTTVSVPNGQTVVLGGMITTLDDVVERKVPWLGDLPLIGRAFRYDSKSSRRTELLIFLTPRVVHNSLDSEMIKQVEAARLHYVESAAEEVHGPLFGVPEEPRFEASELPSGVRDVPIENLELRAPPAAGM
ncbi:MAG: type II and III secretion system protein [Planctomycetota bacterium]